MLFDQTEASFFLINKIFRSKIFSSMGGHLYHSAKTRLNRALFYFKFFFSDCCMHSHKLDKNEQGQATRGKTPPSRKESTSSRRDSVPRRPSVPPPQPSAPTNLSRQNSVSRRSSAPRQPSVARRESMSRSSEERSTKWQATLARDNSYSTKPQSWKDSLRGGSARDSVSPPPRQQRFV